ncbi:MAG: FHA domain-containing protein [Mycobacteriales bacterium]
MTEPLADLLMRPMAGAGVVARFGGVFLVVAEDAPGVADLTGQVVDTCRSFGSSETDGRVLVRRLAGLVAAAEDEPPAFCVVAPHGDDVIVFVHGDAEVLVRLRGGEQQISGRESAAWVDRLVAWPADELVATVPGAQQVAAAEQFLDLRSGVVPGAGFRIMAPPPSTVASGGLAESSQRLQPLPLLDTESPAPETVEVEQQPATTTPPTFESVLLVGAEAQAVEPEDPSGPLPLAVDQPTQSVVAIDVGPAAGAVMVGGIYCSRGHFNDPDALYCGVCGIGLVQQTRHVVAGRRPPLGVLVLDDGLSYVLSSDFVIGRDPAYDDDVREGRALALMVEDPDGGISRSHVAVRLQEWRVVVCDKGSVNGTYIAPPGESVWTALTPFEPVVIKPGTRVQVGRRTFVFDSHQHI